MVRYIKLKVYLMKTPRIQVSVEPKLRQSLVVISEMTGLSLSALIGELLKAQETVFHQLADNLKKAKKLAGPSARRIQIDFGRHLDLAENLSTLGQDVLDQVSDELSQAIEDQEAREVPAQGAGEAPPRGVPTRKILSLS